MRNFKPKLNCFFFKKISNIRDIFPTCDHDIISNVPCTTYPYSAAFLHLMVIVLY